jgi:hypothetical protein
VSLVFPIDEVVAVGGRRNLDATLLPFESFGGVRLRLAHPIRVCDLGLDERQAADMPAAKTDVTPSAAR